MNTATGPKLFLAGVARDGLLAGAFVALYLLMDWISYIHPLHQTSITPWNPQPALAIALLAVRGQRHLPSVLVAIIASDVAVRHAAAGWLTLAVASTVLACGYAAIAATLSGSIDLRGGISGRVDMVRLVAIVAIGAFVTGTLYISATWASGAPLPGPYFEALMQFWIGDCVGILVTLPVLLALLNPEQRSELRQMVRSREFWLQYATIAIALLLAFGPLFDDPFKFFYVLFLPLIWVAARFGLVGAAFATLTIQMGVIIATQSLRFASLTVFELQALLIALAVTGLFLGVIVDERRRTSEELRNSLRLAAAGEMSAALAHELNQPLTALTNYARAGLLLTETPAGDPAKIRDTLEKITREATRAADVVRRLRDFFRTGSTSLGPAMVETVITDAMAAAAAFAETTGVLLRHEITPNLPAVLIDRLQIDLVLKNLIANALQSLSRTEGERRVLLSAAPYSPNFVQISITDSGPGIPEDLTQKVFEPFWSSRATGLGMGLAISRAIVEAHGGRLWIDVERGSSFSLTVPIFHG